MAGQRALLTVVLTDAVGFSAKAGHDEESALRELNADFAIMRAAVEAHGGHVIKTTGDGLLMTFEIPGQAVDCTLDIQTQFASRGPDAFQHRMGVHLCEVVLEENDVHGDGVNLAARLEAEATPGSIAISQTVYDIVKSRLGVEPRALGSRPLKNISDPVTIFELSPTNSPKRKSSFAKAKSGSNWGLTLGLGALAASVLTVGGVIWAKLGNPVITESNPTININRYQLPATTKPSGTAPTSTVSSRTPTTPPPSTPVPPVVKPTKPAPTANTSSSAPLDQSSPAKPQATPAAAPSQTTPASPGTDNPFIGGSDAPGSKRAVLSKERTLIRRYDFDGMLALLDSDPALKSATNHDRRVQKFQRLQQLRTVMDLAIRTAPSNAALVANYVDGAGNPARIEVTATDQGIMIRSDNGTTKRCSLSDLDVSMFRAIATSATAAKLLPRESKVLLTAFDSEYLPMSRLKNLKNKEAASFPAFGPQG